MTDRRRVRLNLARAILALALAGALLVELGEPTREQFRILISAERSPEVYARAGRLVLRGTSPGSRLLAHRDLMGLWRASSGTPRDSPEIRETPRGKPDATRRGSGRS